MALVYVAIGGLVIYMIIFNKDNLTTDIAVFNLCYEADYLEKKTFLNVLVV
jgi:hypothetical protein